MSRGWEETTPERVMSVTRVTGAKDDAVQCRVHLGLIDKTKLLRNVVSID